MEGCLEGSGVAAFCDVSEDDIDVFLKASSYQLPS